MARQLQLRRGNSNAHSNFIGAIGEITMDTDKNSIVVHNGVTQGGFLLAKVSDINNITSSVNLLRADKYLASQNIVNMLYTSGDLTKIRYNNDTDIDYEVLNYTGGTLTSIKHYVGSVLRGTTTLSYGAGNLVSAVFVAA